ncbi:MAG: hypothetical protein JWR80_7464 [Bradyrhizobium sp.]|nr:hypothetical protein [Bradyrhizobium sp.]
MSNRIVTAALGVAALLVAAPAFASTPQTTAPVQGHFEWRAGAQAGPRAPLSPPQRVWVGPHANAMASCDCTVMQASRKA